MRPPRFRLRTLMIAVAAVAVVCGVAGPAALFILPGPTIGAFWMGYRSKGRCVAFYLGSAMGALVGPTVVWICALALELFVGPSAPHTFGDAALVSLLPSLVISAFVAPIVWLVYLVRQNEPA